MTSDVTLGLAFVAGVISFISPCVLPLVPAYIGYMGGRITRQATQPAGSARQRFGTLVHGLFFVLGFTLFFVTFGLLTTAAVSSLTSLGVTEVEVRHVIARVGGSAVILFGLHVMGALNRVFIWLMRQTQRLDRSPYGNLISLVIAVLLLGIVYWLFVESWFMTLIVVLLFTQVFNDALKAATPGDFWLRVLTRLQTALYVDTRRQSRPQTRYGYAGSLLMGVVFSAGWTPCIGPIYGAVLTLASTGGSVSEAGTLLTAYSLGLGIPFLLTALALDQAQGVLRRLQRNMRAIEAFTGAFLILIGVLVFSGQLERISQLGNQGELGDISLNLEHCVVGAVEGRVRWGNLPNCVQDGIKEDFYLVFDKGARTALAAPALQVPELAPAGGSALEVPALGGSSPAGAAAAAVPVGLAVGQRAPDFTAQTVGGETVSLADFRGRPVLLNFWATWCGPCGEEMPDFQAIFERYQAAGFVVLAVNNAEPRDQVASFTADLGITFPVLLDENGAINISLYGPVIPGYPTSLLIDQNGVIVRYFPRMVSGPELIEALETLLPS